MQHGIHFISGLPRAGSTLLAGLLRQNLRVHAAMTSPVGVQFAEAGEQLGRIAAQLRRPKVVSIDSASSRPARSTRPPDLHVVLAAQGRVGEQLGDAPPSSIFMPRR